MKIATLTAKKGMLQITLNGEQRTLAQPLTLAELLEQLGYDRRRVAVEINREIVPSLYHGGRRLEAGDAIEIVTLVGGGAPDRQPPSDKPLQIGKFTFQSRLITGTGKYANYELMRDCLNASGCEVTDIGVAATPLLYYSVFHLKADGAVIITGSHNPSEYNGFKVVSGASTIHGDAIQQLRRIIERRDFVRGSGTERWAEVVTPYVEEIS